MKGQRWNTAYLHVLKTILLADNTKHIFLATLLHFTSQNQFIKNKVCFLKVEDNIQFTDISVVFVHLLNVSMHDFKADQFVVCRGTASDKKEGCVSSVNHFGIYSAGDSISERESITQLGEEGKEHGKSNLCIQENCTFLYV